MPQVPLLHAPVTPTDVRMIANYAFPIHLSPVIRCPVEAKCPRTSRHRQACYWRTNRVEPLGRADQTWP